MISFLVAALWLQKLSSTTFGSEFYVRLSPAVSLDRLASAILPVGKVESRDARGSCYLIKLKPGIDEAVAQQSLTRLPGVHILSAVEEPVDMNSTSSVHRKVRHLKTVESDAENDGESKHADSEAGVDYLAAFDYFLGMRAFPNDTFDWSSWDRARAHAHQMQPTKLAGRRQGSSPSAVQQYWEFLGPKNLATPQIGNRYNGVAPETGRVNALAYDPNNSKIIYVGSAQGGLWKSQDGGTTWNWLSSTWTQLAVNCIVIDPVNTDVIYVGMGDFQGGINGSVGIQKSTDGGITWKEILTNFAGNIGVPCLVMDPTNDQVLIAGTGDTHFSGIYTSTDAGITWTRSFKGFLGDAAEFPAMAVSAPVNGNVRIYSICAGYVPSTATNGPVIVSYDHGKTWNSLKTPVQGATRQLAYSIATSPTNPNNVYILDSQSQKLYVSTDQGNTWTDKSANLPAGNDQSPNYNFSQGYYDFCLACGTRSQNGQNTDILFLGEIDMQQSLDQANSWSSLGGPSWAEDGASVLHNDQHAIAVNPTNPNIALFGNDGGVYSLYHDPVFQLDSVTSLNKLLSLSMFWKIACHPNDPTRLLGGSQDNGSPAAGGDLSNWFNPGQGDGGGCAINQANAAIQFLSTDFIAIKRTSDYWAHQTDISPKFGKGENVQLIGPLVLDPSNQLLLYTASNYLYQWNDGTQVWNPRLGNKSLTYTGANSFVSTIAVAPSDSNTIYTGSQDACLSMSRDGGATWTTLPTEINAAISSISVNPSIPTDILVGYSSAQGEDLYRCPNTSSSSFSFLPVYGSGSNSLPVAPINAIVRDLDDPQGTWYVATDVGVFQTNNQGFSWTNTGFAYGLPDVIIQDMVAVPGTRYLNVGTYGRGMWRLYLAPNGADLVSISATPNPILGGNTAVGTVTLSNPAPVGGTKILLQGSLSENYPPSVTVPQGATSVNFNILTELVTTNQVLNVNAVQETIVKPYRLQVLASQLSSLIIQPSTFAGGANILGVVNLGFPSPPGGLTVDLSSSNSAVKVPTSVVIGQGLTSQLFPVQTTSTTTTITSTIVATLNGSQQSATVTVVPVQLSAFALSPSTVVGGSATTVVGNLTLNGPTSSGGLLVTIKSSNPKVASVPEHMLVNLTGTTYTTTFPITHHPVSANTSVTITVACGGKTFSAILSVGPFALSSLSASPATVQGGLPATGSVALNATPSKTSGAVVVKLSTTSTKAITIPGTVSVPIGATTATFTISSQGVAATTTAAIKGVLVTSTLQTSVTILAPTLEGIAVSPTTVVGGSLTTVECLVGLTAAAPTGGIKVTLTGSNSKAAKVPTSVLIPAGKTSVTFKIATSKVAGSVTVTVTASLGSTTKTAQLQITP